jgi:hypothetical protein
MGVLYRKNISRAFQHPPSCVAFPGHVTERRNVNTSNMEQNTDDDTAYAYTTNAPSSSFTGTVTQGVPDDHECAIKQTIQYAAS